MSLNWIDITILVFLSMVTVRGLMRGFIRAVFDILALAVAIFCAFYWAKDFGVLIQTYIKIPENLVQIISFIAVWIIAYAATTLVGGLIHKLVGRGIFGPLNYLGGGLIGAAKGLLLIWLILQFIFMVPLPEGAMVDLRKSRAISILDPVLMQVQTAYETMGPKKVPDIMNTVRANDYSPVQKSGKGKIK